MFWLIIAIHYLCWRWRTNSAIFVPRPKSRDTWTSPHTRHRRKPDWVIREILNINVWTPKLGCRRIAEIFNRRHSETGFSVSKSYVARLLITKGAELARLRRKLNRKPKPKDTPRNQEWAMDLTCVVGKDRIRRMLLGLIDHGSRACLALHELTDKRSRTIWLELLQLFRRYGLPKRVRVDNEASFNSRWLKLALKLLGVRLITTKPHSPWQNGRIERFFRSFKDDVHNVLAGDLAKRPQEWRWIYNFARAHSGIGYRTPAEAWDGKRKSIGEPARISLWNGALRAHFFPD